MCLPQMALAAASAVVAHNAAEEDFQVRQAQYQRNHANALQAGREEYQGLQLRMIQEQDLYAQKQHQNEIERAEVSAEVENSAAAAGLSGVSLNNLLAGVSRRIAQKNAVDKANYDAVATQIGASLKSVNTTIENRVNSVSIPTAPNPLGYALQGIGGALSAYQDYKRSAQYASTST